MDADNTNNIALLANIHTQAESLLRSLEQVEGWIGLHADKTGHMCFN